MNKALSGKVEREAFARVPSKDDRPVPKLPASRDLKKRFAVVRLWPDKPVAEHENVERLRRAAARLGLELVEVDKYGRHLHGVTRQIGADEVDFVLHLHYETAKTYDAWSYGALWNPLQFYFDWGYSQFTLNQVSHDDFVSTGSTVAEDIILRARPGEFERGGFPILNHTLSEPIFAPELRTDRRAFYCGINWEKLKGEPGRHGHILKALDAEKLIDIYGPRDIEGIHPWEGYNGYRKPLPFDGSSVIRAAADAGIVLVLSSDAHKQSNIMSNRLFECLAAGALIIGDSHPFLKEHFSDCSLVIDESKSQAVQGEQVVEFVEWANSHPTEAQEMAKTGQERFLKTFALDVQLAGLYEHHAGRMAAHRKMLNGLPENEKVSFRHIPLAREDEIFKFTIDSLARQDAGCSELVVAARSPADAEAMQAAIGARKLDATVVDVGNDLATPVTNFGALAGKLIDKANGTFVAATLGCAELKSTYASAALEAFQKFPDTQVVIFHYLLEHYSDGGEVFIDMKDARWETMPAAVVPTIVIRREAYEKHRQILDYLNTELWVDVIRWGLLGQVRYMSVPQVCAKLKTWEGILVRDDRTVIDSEARTQQERLVIDYMTSLGLPAPLFGAGNAAMAAGQGGQNAPVASQLMRQVVDDIVDERLSPAGIHAMPEKARKQLAVSIFKHLPLPWPMMGIMKRIYRLYRRVP